MDEMVMVVGRQHSSTICQRTLALRRRPRRTEKGDGARNRKRAEAETGLID